MEFKIETWFLSCLVAAANGQVRPFDEIQNGRQQVFDGQVIPDVVHWGYGDNGNGPDNWPELFPVACAGIYQSPVDIRTEETIYDPSLKQFIIYDPPKWGSKYFVHNNGHSIQVNTEGVFYVANGGLNNIYRTVQFHFHWGDNNNEQGAEHTIDGASDQMEMHIVNWNTKYSSAAEAAKQPDGLAVLGIFFELSKYDNPILEPLVNVIPSIKDPDWNIQIEIPVVSLRNFLPIAPDRYFRYNGSLTTPRCYESVIWTVFQQKQTISERQLRVFQQVLTSAHSIENGSDRRQGYQERERLVNNYRPVLPLNGRRVYRSFRFAAQPVPTNGY